MSDKVAIVSGGAKGIGAEISKQLLREGYKVVVADLDIKKSTSSEKSLRIRTDVTSENSVQRMIESTIKAFGRIDCLINNAGILPNEEEPLIVEKLPLKTWQKFINTNLTGAFLCSKHAIPYIRKNQGSIVNIASTRFLQSEGNDIPYAASKGGLVSLTHALSINLGPEIRVNCISPGWINSHHEKLTSKNHLQHPAGRVGDPKDIAYLASFLISNEAAFITGQNFIADGGMTVKMIYQ